MKKHIFIIISFLIILSPVKALETDVYANTNQKVENATKIKLENGKNTIKIDNNKLNITSTNKEDNNDIVIIKASKEVLNWIKSKGYNISKAYRLSFYINGTKNMPQGKLSINNKNEKIIILNSKGNKLKDITENDIYICTLENTALENIKEENKIYIDCDKKGVVAINGIMYKDGEIKVDDSQIKIAIIPNKDYQIDKILINGIDKSNMSKGGFITASKGENIKITFKEKAPSEGKTYNILSKIMKNGEILKNVKIIFDGKIIETSIDKNGYYKLKNIYTGYHNIQIFEKNNLIGYKEFFIDSSSNSQINDNRIEINEKINKIILNMSINDYELNFLEVKEKNDVAVNKEKDKDQKNYKFILLSLAVIILIFVYLKKKNKAF